MKLRRLSIFSVGIAIVVLSAVIAPSAPAALKNTQVDAYLKSAVASKVLANPGVLLLDPVTGETIFEKDADSLRMPASLLKLFTAASILNYVQPDFRFTTEILTGAEANTLMISGSLDPWMTRNDTVSKKFNRVSLPAIYRAALKKLDAENGAPIKTLQIQYSDIFSDDLAFIKSQFQARHIKVTTLKVTNEDTHLFAKELIAKYQSPTLQEIVDWMLLWSNNTLGDRLGLYAAMKAGYGYSPKGIQQTYLKTLDELNIPTTGFNAVDGSGLSRSNRVSTRMLAQLLLKTYKTEKYRSIYEGLPVGGETGTLSKRFIKSAPKAIGLARAKTGTLTGVVSLAGYVQGGDHEYIFVVVADKVAPYPSASKAARDAIDKIIASFAKPISRAAL
jgi:serine-type D-Ala-D-Ala carboxypeptidase/endopeptidase (penicillin-binding protein 4)